MKQMSSAIFAVCGSSSLSHAPDLPCCANLKIDGATGKARLRRDVMPVSRWPMRMESGSSVPCRFCQLRLVVEQVDLRRRAGLEQVDDALGLRREVRQAGQAAGCRVGVLGKQRGQRRDADAGAGSAEEMPARDAVASDRIFIALSPSHPDSGSGSPPLRIGRQFARDRASGRAAIRPALRNFCRRAAIAREIGRDNSRRLSRRTCSFRCRRARAPVASRKP